MNALRFVVVGILLSACGEPSAPKSAESVATSANTPRKDLPSAPPPRPQRSPENERSMPKTLKITNGPAKADLLRAVTDNELIAVLRTKDGLVEAHIEVVKESPSGNSFALAGTLQSFQLAGVRFRGTYDTESRKGALTFDMNR